MIAFAYYLLKVIICSGVLFLYYHIALRNKLFHQWNRFYLLISVFISLIAPVIQVSIMHQISDEPNKVIQMLQVFQSADGYLEEVTIRSQQGVTTDQWILIVYIGVSVILLLSVLWSLRKIFSIIRSHTIQWIEKIRFINTNAQGTPFSFFNFIFWNKDIDIQTETGQQIFQHELVHVKEKHTIDKLFIQLILVAFWGNPFFWLIRRELKLIHEFTADKKAVGEHGSAALAAMILSSSFPTQFNSITNQFFQTSIKRRLAMLTKIQNVKINYISRILALPILAITVLAFTFRTKTVNVSSIKLDKKITVVIDAGHGINPDGTHNGAKEGTVYEDDITLAIAEKIRELNANDKIKIVLTRSTDAVVDLHKRVDIAKEQNADLFISLHVNAADPTQNPNLSSSQSLNKGCEIYVSGKEPVYQQQSELFGSVLQQELNLVYSTNPYLLKRKVGVWVLDQNVCPSVLVECGFLTDDKDREFITKEDNQTAIAKKILLAIQRYALNQQTRQKIIGDTIPQNKNVLSENKNQLKENLDLELNSQKPPLYILDGKEVSKAEVDKIDQATIESVNVLKDKSAIDKYGKKGLNGVVELKLKLHNPPLYILDEKEITESEMKNLDPSTIESINVLKDKSAMDKYGKKGVNGVVEIKSKQKKTSSPITLHENGKTIANGQITVDPSTKEITIGIQAFNKQIGDTIPKTSNIPEIKLSDLKNMTGLNISNIKSFTIVGELSNGNFYAHPNKGATFDEQAKILWSSLKMGSILTFENIIAIENGLEVKKTALVYRIVA
jgi:N-acetylmuramoyl-L-alanine amidase